jgi:murein DD-endopeptidase MepM/ murein hydrolase activator NlpD
MSIREQASRIAAPGDRYVVHVARGQTRRKIEISRAAIWGGGALFCVGAAALLCAAGYLLFRDDLLAGLIDRQTRMQYAYEDRVAALRLRLDQALSRQYINQDGVEGKVQSLVIRQAQLETRAAVVAQLLEKTVARDELFAAPGSLETKRTNGFSSISSLSAIDKAAPPSPAKVSPARTEEGALSFAPKPRPQGMDLWKGRDRDDAPAKLLRKGLDLTENGVSPGPPDLSLAPSPAQAAASDLPLPMQLERLANSLDRVEREQTRRLAGVVKPALAAADRLRRAFDVAGLPAERYMARAKRRQAGSAMGGPFIAADPETGASAFERELATAQDAVSTLDSLRRALPAAPLRKPFAGELQLTSAFGYRTDPFLGRPALHSGVDLREDYGAPARATAGGVVTSAGPSGGYGNMVEIDHGGGLSTRYAHLSTIAVSAGQEVAPGAIVGRVGSSGRSTGPHLHYEVRIDGEPVDPQRFLRAATALGEVTR